jgi:hypothetical protein
MAKAIIAERKSSSMVLTNLSKYSCLIGMQVKTHLLILTLSMPKSMTPRFCSAKDIWEVSIKMNSRKFMKRKLEK